MTTISELMDRTKKNNEKFVDIECHKIIENMTLNQKIKFVKESNNITRID